MTEHKLSEQEIQEEWKDIKGFEGLYMVSSAGRIKSLPRWVVHKNGKRHPVKERFRRQRKDKGGYMCIVFNKVNYFSVHRLVAKSFIPNPDNLPEVNHKNGTKDDNRVENLEWCTRLENMRHFKKNTDYSHLPVGSKSKSSKLTECQVLKIRKLHSEGVSRRQLKAQFNMSETMIGFIITRKSWKHI